ncbi:hypothetical protein EDC04DRAFT_2873539 [Pisolithus marmoratus]|nr:hypothetical protein EDC04DRAFT_2873539 [Pisolithus marmoratus]
MATTDALWHTFIHPMAARHNNTSLMHDVGILRPKETGIYQSKPRFRHMHQLITYSGICRRLDCWRLGVANFDPRLTSLEAFTDTKPTFAQLKDVASIITHKYIASNALERHDMQSENALIINKYMLLYEELMHVMNTSDIGQVELCIVAWILIFKATGKHKYAAYMMEFLLNVHFVYPAGLQHAIHYSMLINPSEQQGKFHGVDCKIQMDDLINIGHTLMEKMEGELGQDAVEDDKESFLMLDNVAVKLGL